jgi:hypothetical protein
MKLQPENARIDISGENAIRILQELELVLLSLHKMGAYYVGKDPLDYQRETTRFVDEWKVTDRLASARRLLSECFDRRLADDDMDDLERAMESLNCWSGPDSTAEGDG